MSELDNIIDATNEVKSLLVLTPQSLSQRPEGCDPIDWAEVLIFNAGGQFRDFGGDLDLLPLTHRFTPGMYVREIFMPAGAVVVSYKHKTEHPYVVSKGKLSVYSESLGVQHLEAPYCGITLPGTRRLLFIHEDTVFTTFHLNEGDSTDLVEIEKRLVEPHRNSLLPGGTMHKELLT